MSEAQIIDALMDGLFCLRPQRPPYNEEIGPYRKFNCDAECSYAFWEATHPKQIETLCHDCLTKMYKYLIERIETTTQFLNALESLGTEQFIVYSRQRGERKLALFWVCYLRACKKLENK